MLLVGGAVAAIFGLAAASWLWFAATAFGLVLSAASVIAAARQRRPSVDVIALLALGGALAVGEAFAGAVIAVMLTTGVLLEARAAVRARRDLSLLADRAPKIARRHEADGVFQIPVTQVRRQDRLLVGSGEVVPVDGRLLTAGVFDESTLTGEAVPVERPAGDDVRGGVVNVGQPIDLVATSLAEDSTYAAVVRLVARARASTSPFVRTADRIAVVFVPFTLALAGLSWLVSGDAVRAVAVLVVATPCPLLLAAPIAIMSGLSRAARIGVVIKGGAALEQLAAGRVLLLDKTGTLTRGKPEVTDVITAGDVTPDELLRLAASLDQVSPHPLAAALVTAGRARGLPLELPRDVHEEQGYGLQGQVGERRVRLGKSAWIVSGAPPAWVRHAKRRAALDGSLTVFAGLDGVPAGAFLLEDPIRPDAPRMIRELRGAGIVRTVLVTGDRAEAAQAVARIVGVDAVEPDRDPADKLAVVRAEERNGPTLMVGDGINDAPALAAAGVGIALAARGVTASSEAADVVLTVDRVGVLAEAILIARRSRRIALQAATIGMALSVVAMLAAAAGLLPPAAGAVLQEGIDVLAIMWALRAVLPPRSGTRPVPAVDAAVVRRLQAEHDAVRQVVERVRNVADALTSQDPDLDPVRELLDRLETETLPHERAEQAELYPIAARVLGGADPTGAMTRSHAEIEHQIARLRHLLDELQEVAADPDDVVELRGILYGLYGVLRLHNAQEDEGIFSLLCIADHTAADAG